jgi:hypothetical protein
LALVARLDRDLGQVVEKAKHLWAFFLVKLVQNKQSAFARARGSRLASRPFRENVGSRPKLCFFEVIPCVCVVEMFGVACTLNSGKYFPDDKRTLQTIELDRLMMAKIALHTMLVREV